MGKKKKKVKSFVKGCTKFIELLASSGEILLKKNSKLDISEQVKESVNGTIISRLEAVPTKENIVVDTKENDYRNTITVDNSTIMRVIDMNAEIDSVNELTVVIPMTKKKAKKFEENDTLYWLSKTSSFDAVMEKVYRDWKELNEDDNSPYTNVLYVPKLYLFMDKYGKLRKTPVKVNLLIVALPSQKHASSGIDVVEDTEYNNRIINDTVEAAIKVGAKNIVVDPYVMSALQKDIHYTATYWKGVMEKQRTIENIKKCIFALENDNLYIVFCKTN